MGIAHRKQRKQQIGVSKQQDNLYFVWLDEFYKVQTWMSTVSDHIYFYHLFTISCI